ncbi:sensor histidine kinase [Umezawaea sp. NPDC059074]|uniref:sensor histidine kinase n=1 Tax=Umezawaea sp. NPDC059074 TaxID=3346716 RepID=UPI0036CCC242
MRRLVVWARGHRWTADLPLYAVFAVVTPDLVGDGPWTVQVVPVLVLLPLLVRRHVPRTAAALIVAGAAVTYSREVWAHDRGRAELALAVVVFTLVKRGDRRFAALVVGCVVGLDVVWAVAWGPADQLAAVVVVSKLSLHLAAWAFGEFFHAKELLVAEERRRAALEVSEHRALARAAVAEERTRIARELHDVLAHSVSVIVLNAEGAKLARDPAAVVRTLDTIGRVGRDALADLRRLLGVLHAGEDGRGPQPTVAGLRDLVDRVGRPVRLDVVGDGDGLPASAALHAYRIVQEALTNMVKHAPADATGRVAVAFGTREIRVEVTNTGVPGAPAAVLPSSGRGLAGMRQRVDMYRGTLEAGSLPGGGYRVCATLPVGESA